MKMRKIWKQRYQILEEAGSGGCGKVYKVWDLHLEKEWAMKILEEKIFWTGVEKEDTYNELQVLKRISHPNFPRIVDAFEEDGKQILLMDYIQGISLESMISKGAIREEEIVFIMSQVCEAILYLHQSTPTLLYLDLKPSNIIIEENRTVKLVDLGSVSAKGHGGKISGSFGYASPEQVKVRQQGIYLTETSDIFSFGMVLYAMAVGNSTRLPVVEERNRYGVFVRKGNPFLSIPLEKIIEKCTRGNAGRRYASMREVKKDLENWTVYLKKKQKIHLPAFHFGRDRKAFWYQEKSIFCTEGRHSLYIAKKILILLVSFLCLVPETVSLADSRREMCYYEMEVKDEKEKDEQNLKKEARKENIVGNKSSEEFENLKVVIRDSKLRKVLVKKDCAYETNASILLEIPWEEIEGDECCIVVECEDESRQKKRFYLECVYIK